MDYYYPVNEQIIDDFDTVHGGAMLIDIAGGRGYEASQ